MSFEVVVEAEREIDLDELGAVYTAAFSAPPYSEADDAGLRGRLPLLRDLPGFRLVTARREGVLVGFAYGATGRRGQVWTERIAGRIGEDLARDVLGGHLEVVDIAVAPEARGAGTGRRLLHALLAGRTEPRALLQTWDEDSPAMRLYTSEGFTRLVALGDWVVLVKELH